MKAFQNEGARLTLYDEAPEWQGKTFAVGQHRFTSLNAGLALLNEASVYAREQGATSLIGPMEGDTWHPYRLVSESDGRAPFLMEPETGIHDLPAFTKAGFEVISSYFSAEVVLSNAISQTVINSLPGLKISPWDEQDPEVLLREVHRLSLQAFAQNPFFKSITAEAFLDLYLPLVPLLNPELILFARDPQGALQGFLFGLPNYAEGPEPKSVILKSYASLQKGVGQRLSSQFYRAARDVGYSHAIHALMHERNLSAERSAGNGGKRFRRYALMGLNLGR